MIKRVLAIDFGASSGRAIIGEFNGEKIELTEIHRFSNDPVILNGTMYWDILRLFHEVKKSLIISKNYGQIDSIAIDTWGVDFALIDKQGRLLENPVHYRDKRTLGMVDESFNLINKTDFYNITGIQFMELNTVFQLLSLVKNRPELLDRADKVVLMPDLFNYFLSGKIVAEQSIASTTQLFDARNKGWSETVLNSLGIRKTLMPKIVKSGTCIGELSKELCEELDIELSKIIAVCGHDTQSAIVACPAEEDDFIFLSSGTWSLLGTELDNPIINETSYKLNVTNELGYGEKTSFLKNIIGLWLIQESRRQWIREGTEYTFAQLEEMSKSAQPFKCFIDPDSPEFTPAGNIPRRIKEYCLRTNQSPPETVGEIMRCIYESLALKYRSAKEELEICTGKSYNTIYVIGGGTKDKFLSEMTACSCNCKVSSGPVEATALGNIAVQLMSDGTISDISKAREIIRNSQSIATFYPENIDKWQQAYLRYEEVTSNA